jgi:drug/metabolite transporter (DMT)-like permease
VTERERAGVVGAYAGMCLIWGTTWLAIKIGLRYLPPFTGVGFRFVVAGLVLLVVALMRREVVPLRAMPWKLIAVLTVFLFGLNYILTYTAETRLDSGLVAVLFGTLPFFTFALGHYLAGERTTPRIWLGAAVAFFGVALISLGGEVRGSPLYAVCAIGAAASSAFANVYAKRHAHYPPLVTLPASMLISGCAITAMGISFEPVHWNAAFSAPSLLALAYLAVLGSSIAFFLNLWVLKYIPVWIVGLSSLIIPVIAVTVGITLGHEAMSSKELVGSALVVVGIWFTQSRLLSGKSRPNPLTR